MIFEEFTQDVKGHHCLDVEFYSLVPAFGHVCDEVQVLDEVVPGSSVLLFAYFEVIVEFSLLGDVLVDGCFCKHYLILFGEIYLIKWSISLGPQFLDEMHQYLDLILSVDCSVDNTELPENLQILRLIKDIKNRPINHIARQVDDEFIRNEVIDNKFIILQQLLHEIQMRLLVLVYHVIQDEHDPFRNVDFEQFVVTDQLCNYLVDCVVKLHELLSFVVFLSEDRHWLFRCPL